MRLFRPFLLLISVSSGLFPAFKPWYNYYNAFYGTKAISLGNAFTAVADDGTAAFWNPAGFGRISEPKFYLSFRMDRQNMDEYETVARTNSNEIYSSQFRSRLNQIDFFSIAFPFGSANWQGGGALSYYRYIPTGFKGYSETIHAREDPWQVLKLWRLDFDGSEGIDILAFSAAATFRGIISLGTTMQMFFNTSQIQYQFSGIGTEFSQSESKLVSGENWIFGLLFTPVRFLTVGASYQTPLKSTVNASSQYRPGPQESYSNPEQNTTVTDIALPSRLALGVKIEPFPFLLISYDYSKIFWEKGSFQGFESFNKILFISIEGEEDYRKWNPENHRIGGQLRFKIFGMEAALRGGWFSDRQFYSDCLSEQVTIRGLSLGTAIGVSKVLTLEIGYQRHSARWREKSAFYSEDLYSTYTGSVFSLAMTYNFKKLFSKS